MVTLGYLDGIDRARLRVSLVSEKIAETDVRGLLGLVNPLSCNWLFDRARRNYFVVDRLVDEGKNSEVVLRMGLL